MVIDSSAILAILLQEPEARAIAKALEADPIRFVSAANWLELQMVLGGRFGPRGAELADTLFREYRIEIVPLDTMTAHTAFAAWRQFGKGQHPASLNLGDCCAYATAVLKKQHLLCKGNDFPLTDVGRVSYSK